MSAPDRRGLIDRGARSPSVRRQCALLGVARSGICRAPRPANDNDLLLMRRIDKLYTAWRFLGSRRMTVLLRIEGHRVSRKPVRRPMRQMGIAALGPKPHTTKPALGPQDLPVSLAQLSDRVAEPRMGCGHHRYPDRTGISLPIDWASRAVLAWRLSNTMDVGLCRAALEEALARFGKPEIFNTDPKGAMGQRIHQRRVTGMLATAGIRISRDRRGRSIDNPLHRVAVAQPQIRGHLPQKLGNYIHYSRRPLW
jgi:putative transposase